MAKLEYTIGIKADATQFKQQLQELLTQLNSLGSKVNLAPSLQQASSEAKELAYYMQKATNPETGKLNLTAFNQELQKSGKTISQYATSLNNLGPEGQRAFMQVAKAIMAAEQPLKRSNELMDKLWVTMKNTLRWQISSSALNTFIGSIETAYGYAQDLNESLNNIRIVSGQSTDNMKAFAVQANKAAQALATTTTKYTDAALIYYQQGLEDQQVTERTDITVKMANVTKDSVDTVSDQLTAVWNNFFDNGTQSLEHYADAMTALGAATASSTDEIAGGLEKFSSIADMIGLSFDYAASALATITATTRQSEEVVGTALKTIFARIQGLNLGETLDDGTTLNKYSRALDAVGISIKDQSGELKDMDVILEEMGAKWATLSKDQQVALAQTVAGVRQYNQLVSLMDRWDFFQENLATAQNSDGELDKQAEIYAESWEAARNRVKAAAEGIYDSLIDEDFYISFDNKIIVPLLGKVEALADGMGGLSGVLAVTGALMNKAYGPKIADTIRDMAANIGLMSTSDEQLNKRLQEQTLQAAKNDIVFSTTDANTTGREKQILLAQKDFLDLQNEINEKTKGWTKYQKQGLDYLLQEQKMLQENLELYNQQAYEAQLKVASLDDKLSSSLSMNSSNQNLFATKMDWYERQKISDTALGDIQSQNYTLFEELSQTNDATGAYDKLRASLEKTIRAEAQWKAVNNQVLVDQGKVTDETKKLIINLGLLDQQTVDSMRTEADWANFIKEASANSRGLKIEINTLSEALASLNNGKGSIADVKALVKALEEGYVATERFGQTLKKIQKPEIIQLTTRELKALKQALDAGIISKENFDRIMATQKLPDWTADIIKAGSAVAGFSMFLSSLEGLDNTLERLDEDGLTLNTISSGIMNLVMVGSSLKMLGLGELIKPLSKYFTQAGAGAVIFGRSVGTMGQSIMQAMPYIAAIGVAISLAAYLFDKFTVNQEEAQEAIEESISAYDEEKSKLEELNSELEETEARIKELNNQSSLTIVEQEELKKLEQSISLLKEQQAVQTKITKQQQAQTAQDVAKNYKKAAQVYDYQYSVNVNGQKYTTEAELQQAILQSTNDNLTEQLEEGLSKWRKKQINNLETLDVALENYQTYQQAIEDEVIENNEHTQETLAQMQAQIKKLRIVTDGELEIGDDAGYYAKYLSDMDLSDQLVQAAAGKKITFKTEEKNTLANYGVNELEVSNWIQGQADTAARIAKDLGLDYDKASGAAIQFVAGLDFEELQGDESSIEIIQNALDNKAYDVTIKANVIGLEDIQEAISAAITQNDTFQEIFDDYSEKGYLTATQVHQLLEEDSSLAQYLIDRGNGQYGLTQSAVDKFYNNNSVIEEGTSQELEQLRAGVYGEGRSRIAKTYSSALDQIAAVSDEFSGLDEKVTAALATWAEDSDITTSTLVDNLMTAFDESTELFAGIGSANLTELDKVAQETYGIISTLLANLYTEQTKLFQTGQINAKEYTDSLAKITAANIKLQKTQIESQYKDSHNTELVKQGVIKEENGKWVKSQTGYDAYIKNNKVESESALQVSIKSNIEQLEEEAELLDKVKEKEDQLKKLTQFDAFENTMVNYYDYLEPYLDALGHIDTTLDINVNDSQWKAFYEELFVDFAKLDDETRAKVMETVSTLTEGMVTTFDEVKTLSREGNKEVTAAFAQGMDEAATETSSDVSSTIADLLDETAKTIDSFETTITITPDTSKINSGDLAAAMVSGDPEDLPNFTYNISASGTTDAISSATNAIRSLKVSSDSLFGRMGGFKYGTTNSGNDEAGIVPNTGSGSKSSTLDRKDPKELKRYKEINRLIEKQNDLLKKNETLTDRAVGADKLKGFDDQLATLEQQQEYYKRKQNEAKDYLITDRREFLKAIKDLDVEAQFNGDELVNYESIMTAAKKPLDAITEEWNRLADSQVQVSSEQKEALEARYNAALEYYETVQDTADQYLETLDTIDEMTEELAEAARWAADIKLDKLTTKVEIIVDAKEGRDSHREMLKELQGSFGDAISEDKDGRLRIQNIMGLDKEMMEDNLALIPVYKTKMEELAGMLRSNDPAVDRDSVLAELQGLEDDWIELVGDLNQYIQDLEERFPEALDAAKNRYVEFTDALSQNSAVLDLVKQLYELQGVSYKTLSGFKSLYKTVNENYKAQLAKADLQKQWYDSIAGQLEEAEAALEGVAESDVNYDILKGNRDALLEEYYEAQTAYLESAQQTMETARELFTLELQRAGYEFEEALTNGLGLSALQEQYEHYIEENERYFDAVNEAYEVASWYNKLQKDIDDANNVAYVQKLKLLQEEIDMRAESGTLNQYDLDILEAKYNLLQAQMALEDAKNAKNNLQLVRDSQGNWNYQYTADQDGIADAEQKVLDAQNEWYNIAKDQTEDVTQQIVSNWQDAMEAVQEIYDDDTLALEEKEAKANEILRYYSEKATDLEREKWQAITDMTEAGELAIEDYDTTYSDSLANMTAENKNFEETLRQYLQECKDNYGSFQEKVSDVAETTGTDMSGLNDIVNDTKDSTGDLKEASEELILTLDKLLGVVRELVTQMSSDNEQVAQGITTGVNGAGATSNIQTEVANGMSYDASVDYNALLQWGRATGLIEAGSAEESELFQQRNYKIYALGLNETIAKTKDYDKYEASGEPSAMAKETYSESEAESLIKKLLKNAGFDTGGYTGIFDDARLAFVHQKELILNANDTENMLAAVQVVRDLGSGVLQSIEKALDNNVVSLLLSLGQNIGNYGAETPQTQLEQTIHIDKIEFPNATDRNEIEEAFRSLTNDAVQWAGIRG